MRLRSHKYPDDEESIHNGYIDTTYYDKHENYLDIAYQRLKIFDIKLYPELSHIKKLFIDHNNLKYLPEPKYVPLLEELTCSVNNLTDIPFYPNLTFLNISHNRIINCNQYHNSKLIYFDCSYNNGFKFNFSLPKCKNLYIEHTNLKSINLNLTPKLEILDCGNNQVVQIIGGENLIEVNVQYNQIKYLPKWIKLQRLVADNNLIIELDSLPNLISACISYNHINKIKSQPKLKKLIATNNNISIIDDCPELEIADLSHNNISSYKIPRKIQYLSIQFNPITNLVLSPYVLSIIKELQVNYKTYQNIYHPYYQNFEAVHIQTNGDKLEQLLKKLSDIFNENMIQYIFNKFNNIKFKDRSTAIFKIVLKLYWDYFSTDKIETLKELIETKEFQYLLKNMTKLYYKTIVITLFFNGHIG